MAGSIRFFGAVRNVTGSRHLIEWEGESLLLECGLVQGKRRKSREANEKLPFDPKEIDHVVLSHAHIDHSGALPVLVRDGYRGKIWATHATVDLCDLMLRDSGYIQEADAAYLNKHRARGQSEIHPVYTQDDAVKALPHFKGVAYRERVDLSDNISFEFLDAGHILGSAMVVVELRSKEGAVRVGFTGDHGREAMPILRDPAKLPEVDYLISESTYGNRLHTNDVDLEQDLRELILEEDRDGGRILIPAFAVGRTQNIVYVLGRLLERGEIPKMRVFVDSPMATEATRIVAKHTEVFDSQISKMIQRGQDPFYFDGIRYTRTVEESMALNDQRNGCIIISASGMMESGRVLHHFKRSASRKEDCVLIVGYQAPHTLGRRLVEGRKEVRVYGKEYRVRCKVRVMNGLSAHGDWSEIRDNVRHLAPKSRGTFLIHGDEEPALAMQGKLEEVGFDNVTVPVEGKRYPLKP